MSKLMPDALSRWLGLLPPAGVPFARGKDAGPPPRPCVVIDDGKPKTFTTCEPPYCTHDPEPLPAGVPKQYEGVCLHCLARGIPNPDGTRTFIVFDGKVADREAGQ
jgi:hypothetical protein